MKKLKPFFTHLLLTVALPFALTAAKPPVVKWTVKNPFEQKVFIENKGQYEIADQLPSKDILFGARQGGLQYYFTTNSIWIRRDKSVKRTDQEIEYLQQQSGNESEEKEKQLEYKTVSEYHEINFADANPLAQITSDNKVSWHYNFILDKNTSVKANAYKKLIYLNLYPGIDMEFYFREDTTGFEYSFIVHPGADVSQLKMQYPLSAPPQLTANRNIVVTSSFGNFIDHAPVANQQRKTVACSFAVANSIVGFIVNDYDKTKDLLIDPWNNTPLFPVGGSPYDVDWDNAGNCYIYGGNANPNYTVIKYNPAGTMLWSTTSTLTNDYGDFAVDKSSQSVYMVQGWEGGGVDKLDASGALKSTWSPVDDFTEMWRITFNRCSDQAVIIGGGVNVPSYQVCLLDTTLTNLNPVPELKTVECCHDLWGVTLDNAGNCYMASTKTANYSNLADSPSLFDNKLLKVPVPALQPITWEVSDNYKFVEIGSNYFYKSNEHSIGFNGMTFSNATLYTYDSYVLKAWNPANGALTDSLKVNGNSATITRWSGLTSDNCNNIFLGSHNKILQYDINLNLINTITATDTVYDVMLDNNNLLYACGLDFVSVIQVNLPNCGSGGGVITVNSPTICKGNTAVLTANGAGTYTWSPSAGLSATTGSSVTATVTTTTTYTVVGKTSCGIDTTTSVITVDSVLALTVVPDSPTICNGQIITLSVSGGGSNFTWSPDSSLNGATGSSVIASPTVTTTYTVMGKDSNNCPASGTNVVSVIPSPNKPYITVSVAGDSLVSSSTQGNQWYLNDSIITGATNQILIINPQKKGSYLVIVINPANGCTATSDSLVLTDINQLSQISTQISLYPNPFNNTIFITINSLAQNIKDWSLKLTDVLGRTLFTKPSLNYSNEIDLSNLPSGFYFITIINKTERAVLPVVKQ